MEKLHEEARRLSNCLSMGSHVELLSLEDQQEEVVVQGLGRKEDSCLKHTR